MTIISCIGAGYVGGPTMAMIALKCPHIQVLSPSSPPSMDPAEKTGSRSFVTAYAFAQTSYLTVSFLSARSQHSQAKMATLGPTFSWRPLCLQQRIHQRSAPIRS